MPHSSLLLYVVRLRAFLCPILFLLSDNNLLGTFEVCNIPPAPKGVPQIEVVFDLDADGILHVYAGDTQHETTHSHITISNDKSRLTASEIEQMLLMSQLFQEEDRAQEAVITSKQSLQAYTTVVKNTIEQFTTNGLAEEEKQNVRQQLDAIDAWLKHAEDALHRRSQSIETDTADDGTVDEPAALTASDYDSKQRELESTCQPILRKLFQLAGSTSDATLDPESQLQSALAEAMQQLQIGRAAAKGEGN